jgi:lipoyl-dependent peroxiredoxin
MTFKVRRCATAKWLGAVDVGVGEIAFGSGAFSGPYSLRSRVGDEPHTSPEELIGAGLAGCFAMSVANLVAKGGHAADEVSATATVTLERVDGSFALTRIDLVATGHVPDLEPDEFVQLAEEAKATCPISRALAGVSITLDAALAPEPRTSPEDVVLRGSTC